MSTNDRETEELLLKGLATGHVWKVYRNKSFYMHNTYYKSSSLVESRRTTWRKCLRCGEATDSYWTKNNSEYYERMLPCQPQTTTKK